MNEIIEFLKQNVNDGFVRAIISNPREKGGVLKIKVRPLEKNGEVYFQAESFTKTQAFHENMTREQAVERLAEYMGKFRQMQLDTTTEECTVLVSKKGKATIKRKKLKCVVKEVDRSHNRKKRYILEEGIFVPFLYDLGVITNDGKIVRTKMDKFRQINRFLEFIEDILPQLDQGRELTVLDFGCGKSYLTFAMYYYLHELRGYDIRVIGLDLKETVIDHCNKLAEKYGYEKLTFLVGDIADYEGVNEVDLVVTLHACNTATDYALAKAIGWNAKVILSVPCCQHEINTQWDQSGYGKQGVLAPIMEYGLLRERFAALVTDGLRAQYLEQAGYEAQILEFIDMEHTPKNILIRAVKKNKRNKNTSYNIKKCEEFLEIHPTLGVLLEEKGENSEL